MNINIIDVSTINDDHVYNTMNINNIGVLYKL